MYLLTEHVNTVFVSTFEKNRNEMILVELLTYRDEPIIRVETRLESMHKKTTLLQIDG